jgi:hypothetical protein
LTPLFVGSIPTTPDKKIISRGKQSANYCLKRLLNQLVIVIGGKKFVAKDKLLIILFSVIVKLRNKDLTFHLLSSKVIRITGLVAQWTRAHGYEPWCQGFESLLARLTW